MSATSSGQSYGQCAVGLGFTTEARVKECLDVQAKIREMGIDEPLGEILVKKGYITGQQHLAVLKQMGLPADPIPGFKILAKIGKGGMGTVYKANQTSINRIVALKVLAGDAIKDPTYVTRFFQEAKSAAKLSHPNLIAAIDVGEANGIYYFVMEFVTGKSCRELVNAGGPFDEKKALDVAAQMAEVLEHIHHHRMVHRDIKPENILLTPEGAVKLCDFGLAKSTVAREQGVTQAGFAVGTPQFMSPEQIRGEPDVDIRADLYSLGATLHFLATGRPPYEGKSAMDVMAMHLNDPVPDLRAASPPVSDGFAALVRRLMAKTRLERYASPAELLEDLKRVRAGDPPRHRERARDATTRVRAVPKLHSTHRFPAVREKSSAGLILGVVGAVVVLIVGALIFLGGGSPPPPKPPPPIVRTPEPAAPVAEASPKDAAALAALKRAKEFETKNPADLAGAVALYETAAKEAEGSGLAAEARRELEAIRKKARAAELAAVETELRAALDREEFARAAELLKAARGRRSDAEWTSAIDRKLEEVTAAPDRLYADLKPRALEAKSRGASEEVKAVEDRVARWGLPSYRDDLAKALAVPVPASLPATPPDVRAYRGAWRHAMLLAGGRDYAGAIPILEQAAAGVADATFKAEATADLELFRQVAAFHADALQILAKWPRGQKLALEFWNESGAVQRMEDAVAKVEPFRLEYRKGEDSVAVEYGEVLASSLADVARAKKGLKDGRVPAVLCLWEGEVEAAQRHAGDAASAIPEKYWSAAKFVAALREQGAPKETLARAIFYQAERDVADASTLADGLAKHRSLLKEMAETSFVRRNRAAIAARLDGGREYFFFADQLRGGGTFKGSRMPKGEGCWTSEADSDGGRLRENYVEAAFSVVSEAEYRVWFYVGGCCMETLGFQAQVGEPGRDVAAEAPVPVKQSIITATRTHASHGGQKQPSRWGWVQVLLRPGAPGPRAVRLLTDQKGFSVGYAFVSSVKTAPPKDLEVKAMDKARDAAPIVRAAPVDPTLVGWWRLDDRTGTVASDASRGRNHGTLMKGAAWAAGKLDGAVSLDGQAAHVRVAGSPSLNGLTDKITVAAWALRQARMRGWNVLVARQRGTGDNNHFVLGFNGTDMKWLVDTGQESIATAANAPMGEWFHLAGVFDGKEVLLYLNGKEVDGEDASGKLSMEDNRPLLIGADPLDAEGGVHEAFQGMIDDVRIYARALTPAEIAALASGKK